MGFLRRLGPIGRLAYGLEKDGQRKTTQVLKKEKSITLKEMKDVVMALVGSKFPVRITTSEGAEMIRYIRGFADAEGDIVLLSDTSFSLAMKILEIKEIASLEFSEDDGAPLKKYRAKWIRKKGRLFTFLPAIF